MVICYSSHRKLITIRFTQRASIYFAQWTFVRRRERRGKDGDLFLTLLILLSFFRRCSGHLPPSWVQHPHKTLAKMGGVPSGEPHVWRLVLDVWRWQGWLCHLLLWLFHSTTHSRPVFSSWSTVTHSSCIHHGPTLLGAHNSLSVVSISDRYLRGLYRR